MFVNNGFTGGDIETVIQDVSDQAGSFNGHIRTLKQEADLLTECRNSIRGTSSCIGGIVFFSSPNEGPGGRWNYTLRADGALGSKIVTDKHNNDAEIYLLPLQHAVDRAISGIGNGTRLPPTVEEYPYTSRTQKQENERIRIRYMGGIIDVLAIAFFIGMVGVTYQLTGIIATEREIGMAQLLDCMMPNRRRWEPQMARIVANHLAFDLIYGPGWIVMGIILSVGVFSKTSTAIVVIQSILSGLAMSSLSILGGAFFRKAQLSGITSVIVSLLLAIIAQVAGKAGTASVTILSLLFPPMNYVYFTILTARWERQNLGVDLLHSAPKNTATLPGIVFWVFSIIQILVFPILGAWVEKTLYGTTSKERRVTIGQAGPAVALNGFTKLYPPTLATRVWNRISRKPAPSVTAVNGLNLEVAPGSLNVLLGANGSGKSTTLDAIAGLNSLSAGAIDINYKSAGTGLGFCPQKNVLWDDLTVGEHLRIFNKLKSEQISTKAENEALLVDCDIAQKISARSKTLSGGQKRKIQLAMMFTGGSSICCVDEVSSGLDPISRRKIWDILLAKRGEATIILTTHFLDEADLLADHIAMLSKGSLKASGTTVELKQTLGAGYRVHVYHTHGHETSIYDDITHVEQEDQTIYALNGSAETAAFVSRLEKNGVLDFQVSGPTIEDVFLKLAEEVQSPKLSKEDSESGNGDEKVPASTTRPAIVTETLRTAVPELLTGRRIGVLKQVHVLFRKRWVVFLRNPLPYMAALLIPIIAAGLVTLFLKNFELAGCEPISQALISDIYSLSSQVNYSLVAGPSDRLTPEALETFANSFGFGAGSRSNATQLAQSIHIVNTLQDFNSYIHSNFANVTPGGIFLGDGSSPATFAWRGNYDISLASITQNAIDNILSGISISTQYQAFDINWAPGTGDSLQLITYFGLAMSVYPSFFALYPTIERLRSVRGLHYSNGVRAAPLWLAYTMFDFMIVLVTSAVAVIIFRAVTDVWYHLEYLFVVLFLYGLASTLLSYVISLVSRSQLSAFAFAAGGQAVMFLLYFIAFMSVLTYAPTDKIDDYLNVCHFTIAAISPVANLTRALFITLNVFSVTCRNRDLLSYPGATTGFGGPILYLILQTFMLFGVLWVWDTGSIIRRFRTRKLQEDAEEKDTVDSEVSNELKRVASARDGLRVLNITKKFKSNLAVNSVTFGVPKSEITALLGPNGAGKSTIISMIRGHLQPSQKGGDIFVEDISVIRHRAQARARLGVCPQFDAIDKMTVKEHLDFYARARGVTDPRHNVQAVMQAVGMEQYADRMAEKLSGGNKRKLSLGIALMGNPSVLLLDEPSSGMDAASKRVMWRTLESVVPGRSIVLTTHSMEEADALASRAAIVASKMLAIGTTDYLRRKHGDAYYIHVVHRDAPHSSEADMIQLRHWIMAKFPDAEIEAKVYGGQLRFTLPLHQEDQSSIASLFSSLEEAKNELGVTHYSVSRATLDQVFLSIVGKHNVEEEEGARSVTKKRRSLWRFRSARS